MRASSFAATNTTTTLASSLNPSTAGNSVTFTATVTPFPAGAATVNAIRFWDGGTTTITGSGAGTCGNSGGTQIGASQTVDATGHASVTTSTLTAGSHTISACYQGNGGSSGTNSSQASLTQTVNAPPSPPSI